MHFRTRSLVLALGLLTSAARAAPTITVDTTKAPDLAELGAKVKVVAETWYPKIIEALPGKDFVPPDQVTIVFDPDFDGVAATGGDHVICSVKYFSEHPDDLGAFVHELVHVVQHYTNGDRPGWLVEGIADNFRFFHYEPESERPHPNPAEATYHDSYRTSAHFLDWAQRTYDPQLVVKLNEACRTATYSDELWKTYTGKTLEQLGDEWKASLPRPTTKPVAK